MKHAGEILILTGPPGSGKTTTAQALAEESGSPKVHLHSDDFWHFIKTVPSRHTCPRRMNRTPWSWMCSQVLPKATPKAAILSWWMA
ncbi:ATP-binding protein [Magnetospirillum sulfuroxidans]|uniref:AAA family ATPase n=1 Tax=Magnetospirillum sulfuroxidans TaxID=611300 RepID=A0ABS5IHF0_9PROT|nr:AAA family ATPase [Magnetospirillum sulfuroxidans]